MLRKENFNESTWVFQVNKTLKSLYSEMKQYISLVIMVIRPHKFNIN